MKIKKYIQSLGLSLTDCCLIPFLLIGSFFLIESTSLTFKTSNMDLSMPFFVYLIFIGISLLSLSSFLFFQYKNHYRPRIIPLVVLSITLIITLISIFSNPNNINVIVKDIDGLPIDLHIEINNQVKVIHSFSFFFFIVSVYLGIVIVPKRIKSINFISLITYAFYLTTIYVFIYSLINDDYVSFFGILFGNGGFAQIKQLIPYSIFGNPNVYAFYLEFTLFLSLLNFSITKKSYNLIASFICYLLLLLTLCKAGILAVSTLLIGYIIFKLIKGIIKKDSRTILFTTFLISIAAIIVIAFTILYGTNENLRTKLSYSLDKKDLFSGRDAIWAIGYNLFLEKPIFGFGHGVYNSLLLNATTFNSSHNAFLAMLGEGGIIYLSIYSFLILYGLYLIIRTIRKNIEIGTSLLFGILVLLTHSIMEDIYYYITVVIIISCIVYNTLSISNSAYVDTEKSSTSTTIS